MKGPFTSVLTMISLIASWMYHGVWALQPRWSLLLALILGYGATCHKFWSYVCYGRNLKTTSRRYFRLGDGPTTGDNLKSGRYMLPSRYG